MRSFLKNKTCKNISMPIFVPHPYSDFFLKCTLHTYISTCKNLHVPLNKSFNLDKPMWE